MEKTTEKTLNIKLKDKEIKSFKNILSKLKAESEKSGFNRLDLSKEEKELIKELED